MKETDFIKRTYPYLLVAFFYVLVVLTLHAYFEKEQLHLWFNAKHSKFGDFIFPLLTNLGGFSMVLIFSIYVIFKGKWRDFIWVASTFLLQLIIVQFIKRSFFKDHLRPSVFFAEKGEHLHLVDGVEQLTTYTFPSGHSAAAFTMFLIFAFYFPNRILQTAFGLLAILVALSRVYLSQHFMLDTAAGALIGVFSGIFCYYLVYERKKPAFLNQKIIRK